MKDRSIWRGSRGSGETTFRMKLTRTQPYKLKIPVPNWRLTLRSYHQA